ncbi:MAG: DUF362 domain-containing protein [Bilophila wadsworthia]|uniref:DUF362 domain-containing protein n=1 Tax=Bilophila wadsworthia TaxID=35833 RepID=UPI00300F4724
MNYDADVLTHFKGHTVGGFGGSLKNISNGCASGKLGQAAKCISCQKKKHGREARYSWNRMVEGGKAITNHFGQHTTYINVLRNCPWIATAPGWERRHPQRGIWGCESLDGYSGRQGGFGGHGLCIDRSAAARPCGTH